ncbi:hypothetical protein [Rhizobium sp. SAFR-030]|uniref:hypothetical protein n=1 Tax=Rhizobium sp. SAFR-030 TaxID=3387277 RepID=UPI003F81A627
MKQKIFDWLGVQDALEATGTYADGVSTSPATKRSPRRAANACGYPTVETSAQLTVLPIPCRFFTDRFVYWLTYASVTAVSVRLNLS